MSANIPAAERTLDILTALASAPGPVTASGLARDLRIPRSTAYQLLEVLVDRGFVTHLVDEHRWTLGLSAFEVGAAYLRGGQLEHVAEPLLRRLARDAPVPVVAHLGILRGHEVVYVLKEQSDHIVTTVTEVGVRLPAALTASGRAMLACLTREQVRAQMSVREAFVDRTGRGPRSLTALNELIAQERRSGHSEEDGFITEGFASVAVAVTGARGEPIASVGLTFRTDSAPPGTKRALANAARRCAEDIEARMARHGSARQPASVTGATNSVVP